VELRPRHENSQAQYRGWSYIRDESGGGMPPTLLVWRVKSNKKIIREGKRLSTSWAYFNPRIHLWSNALPLGFEARSVRQTNASGKTLPFRGIADDIPQPYKIFGQEQSPSQSVLDKHRPFGKLPWNVWRQILG